MDGTVVEAQRFTYGDYRCTLAAIGEETVTVLSAAALHDQAVHLTLDTTAVPARTCPLVEAHLAGSPMRRGTARSDVVLFEQWHGVGELTACPLVPAGVGVLAVGG